MVDESKTSLSRMIDHWWWRPGWSVGRQFYTWQMTFEYSPDVGRLADEYAPHLELPGLDLIPNPWLHLTMQGIGFVGEVNEADVDRIVSVAQTRLAGLEPFTISLGPAVVDPEVVRLQVTPAAPVSQLRRELRAAIADVRGASRVPDDEQAFTPHVSLAYSNRDGDMQPIHDAAAVTSDPAEVTVRNADLIRLNRDYQQYEWIIRARVPIGR